MSNYTNQVQTVVDKCPYHCTKCLEGYKTLEFYKKHIRKCIGIDSLTCPRCMKTYAYRSNKSAHKKENSCEPVSLFVYVKRKYGADRDTSIFVNPYGSERNDYISDKDIICLVSNDKYTALISYTLLKHFHPKFPENHNVTYFDKFFRIKREERWLRTGKKSLLKDLYNDNKKELLIRLQLMKNTACQEEIDEIEDVVEVLENESKRQYSQFKNHMIKILTDSINQNHI